MLPEDYDIRILDTVQIGPPDNRSIAGLLKAIQLFRYNVPDSRIQNIHLNKPIIEVVLTVTAG